MYPTISFAIIVLNVIVSWQGFKNGSFFDRFSFRVDSILKNKEYIRLISSGFLHVSWTHLLLNMISLYLFSNILEAYMGSIPFLIVYLAGLIGGNLLALLIHRRHADYSSVGASGAVCGIIFASIALFPFLHVGMLFIPLYIPGWLYGLAYMLYSIYGIRSKTDNIGHEAHLGGALVGMFTALAFHPYALAGNLFTICIISVPALFFIFLILTRPHLLLVDNYFFNQHANANLDDRYNLAKRVRQQEIDHILDKIHRKGMTGLTKEEKEKLDEYSRS